MEELKKKLRADSDMEDRAFENAINYKMPYICRNLNRLHHAAVDSLPMRRGNARSRTARAFPRFHLRGAQSPPLAFSIAREAVAWHRMVVRTYVRAPRTVAKRAVCGRSQIATAANCNFLARALYPKWSRASAAGRSPFTRVSCPLDEPDIFRLAPPRGYRRLPALYA